jgi:glycosyltransferase involved in cell wall biosynthesis
MFKVWIVMPAHNEESSIGHVLDALKAEGYTHVIVVDDGSEDKTAEVARKRGAVVISHPKNMGLGAALRTGLKAAFERGADRAVTFDADGQHDPKSVRKLLEALDGGDLAIGVREKQVDIPLHKVVGNFGLDFITYLFSGVFTDSQSGARAFNRRALELVRIKSDRYEVSSEIIIRTKQEGLGLREVPVRCFYTKYSKARGTTIASGFKIFLGLVKQRINR